MTEETTQPPALPSYKYNTVSLEKDFMVQMIGYGDAVIKEEHLVGFSGDRAPDLYYLNIAHWFSWVPESVQREVQLLASRAMERANLSPSRRDLKVRFIAEFQDLLAEKVEKLPGLKAKFEALVPERVRYDVERIGLDDSDTKVTLRILGQDSDQCSEADREDGDGREALRADVPAEVGSATDSSGTGRTADATE